MLTSFSTAVSDSHPQSNKDAYTNRSPQRANLSMTPPSAVYGFPSPLSVSPPDVNKLKREEVDMRGVVQLSFPQGCTSDQTAGSEFNLPRMNQNQLMHSSLEGPSAREKGRVDNEDELEMALKSLLDLKKFLRTAPNEFEDGDIIRQFRLPNDEQISCVKWSQDFCITGTDIVRSLVHRFAVFGREVSNRKKFEEGIFSDLRNLKVNVDSTLQGAKSELLEFLYKRHCVRTKKKQKVFYWFSVQHNQLFLDALARELKKESLNSNESHSLDASWKSAPTLASTVAVREPALSFKHDPKIPLNEQIRTIMDHMKPSHARLFREVVLDSDDEHMDNLLRLRNSDPESSVFYGGNIVQQENPYGNPHDRGLYPSTQYIPCADTVYDSLANQPYKSYPISPRKTSVDNGHSTTWNPNGSSVPRPYVRQQESLENTHQSDTTPYWRIPGNSFVEQQYSTAPSIVSLQSAPQKYISLDAISHQTEHSPDVTNDIADARSISHMDRLTTALEDDFPLEFLCKEDLTDHYPYAADGSNSFQAEYSDFAHQNRPALNGTFQVQDVRESFNLPDISFKPPGADTKGTELSSYKLHSPSSSLSIGRENNMIKTETPVLGGPGPLHCNLNSVSAHQNNFDGQGEWSKFVSLGAHSIKDIEGYQTQVKSAYKGSNIPSRSITEKLSPAHVIEGLTYQALAQKKNSTHNTSAQWSQDDIESSSLFFNQRQTMEHKRRPHIDYGGITKPFERQRRKTINRKMNTPESDDYVHTYARQTENLSRRPSNFGFER